MGQLEGKVAIVTGASRGIGAGAAFVLAKAGAAIMLVARDGKRALQLAEEIGANGGQATASADRCPTAPAIKSGRRCGLPPERESKSAQAGAAWRSRPEGLLW
jgi:NAD(P)-dependent dehydrogenase (short-subunit alcohol dehydrogenase family)